MGFLVYLLPWVVQRRRKTAVIAGLVGVLIVAYERWQIVPADTGWTLMAGFAVNAVLSAVFGLVASIRTTDRVGFLMFAGKLAAAAVLGLALLGASAPMFHARQYHALGGVTVKAAGSEAFSDIDITELVVVPQETARNKARQVVGQYGSQFSIGKFYLQKFKGDLVYAAVLEPTGLFTQMSAGASPGYVVVSATDQSAPAKLVTGFSFRYTEDGFWGHWLPRYVRAQFPAKVFSEFSFELDETGRPFWVGSAGHYAIGVGAVKIDSVIVVDPQTGEATLYPLDRIPDWIEQAVPEEVAAAYARWWGEYELGWWNSVLTQRGVKVLTEVTSAGRQMVGVNGADGKFRYFSGMTSPNKSDTSLIGYMVIDSALGR
ncbi:MAG TPA: hypothetical protein VGK74_18615 [Symbiobacteriaceae bacterium]